MNDPGLEDPINHAATDAKRAFDGRGKNSDTEHNAALHPVAAKSQSMPTRYWYASTAFPLIAGTFGPLANAFSICALVENWRVSIPPGGTQKDGIDIPDPRYLIAVNAVSLAFALIANLSLLLNMTKRLRFEIAQPITILGFFVASVLLIALLANANTSNFHAAGVQDQALSQAYYYAIFATAQYQIIAYLMCVTVWGAYRGHYAKDFELTVAQRTLMLQTIMFLVYLLVGALIYSNIEGWKFLDAVYWMDYTLLTVGIGDYAPATHLGRGLLFPIAIGGIITVGLVVSSIRALILDRGAEQISNRVMEKTRRQVVKEVENQNKKRRALQSTFLGLKKDAVNNLQLAPTDDGIQELTRRKTEFEVMRNVQEMADRQRKYVALLVSAIAFAILWFVGAVVFWKSEGEQEWTYFASLYFCYTSILTIGYGDLAPESDAGRAFFVFWSLLAVPTLTVLISNMGDTVVKGVKDATIWLGEISFLPSTEQSTTSRIRRGLYRATFGQWAGLLKQDQEASSSEDEEPARKENDEWAGLRDSHPGLVQLFKGSELKKIHRKDMSAFEHVLQGWSDAHPHRTADAKLEPHEAHEEAARHYRHLLITLMPGVYAESKRSTPKKYTYAEWAVYLRVLGENEAKAARHSVAHITAPDRTNRRGSNQTGTTYGPGSPPPSKEGSSPAWSWIGRHSPLMQTKSEAEWILERLFQKLEESLKQDQERFQRQK